MTEKLKNLLDDYVRAVSGRNDGFGGWRDDETAQSEIARALERIDEYIGEVQDRVMKEQA
jgi:hypothetical protein